MLSPFVLRFRIVTTKLSPPIVNEAMNKIIPTSQRVWPIAEPVEQEAESESRAMELFPRSEEHPPSHGGVLWLLNEARVPRFELAEQRLVDAVAVAGMTATLRSRRRAVVLVLSERPTDSSRLRPSVARHYLAQLGVPLFVWVVGDVSDPMRETWGSVRSVETVPPSVRAGAPLPLPNSG